jgi:hypothetical protein
MPVRPDPVLTAVNYVVQWQSGPPFERAFPDDCLPPSSIGERGVSAGINFPVPGYLCAPEVRARRWPFEQMAVVPMPEAAVRKNHCLMSRKYNVRLARQCGIVEPKTQSARVKPLSK